MLKSQSGTVGHCSQHYPNLTRIFYYINAEKVKATHHTFYVQLPENRLNLIAIKVCKKH